MEPKIDFFDEISNFIFTNKYARYNEIMSRRETWDECISRVEKMHVDKFKKILSKDDLTEVKKAFNLVREKKIAPSMRSMQFAGKAIDAHASRLYNCTMRHVDSIRAFSESFYMLLCGNGVGFGLSNYFINRFPNLVGPKDKNGTIITYIVQDSIEGWSDSLEALLNCYFRNTAYSGRKIVFDYSRIRPEGAQVKTGGGKAPGYKGLKRTHKKIKELLDYIIEELNQTQLNPINAYDILMHCADAVLSGGIRRSACIAIFDKEDELLLNSKTNFNVTKYLHFTPITKNDKPYFEGVVYVDGKYGGRKNTRYDVTIEPWEYEALKSNKTISWIHIEPQRARSNNSVLLLRDKTTREEFLNLNKLTQQWGEPGIVFADHPWVLCNPCVEISTIPVTSDGICGAQNCNLSTNNGAKIKTLKDFIECVIYSTLLGTLQAAYTDFKYLGKASRQITEEEALLGVSITGMMDNPDILLNPEYQRQAAEIAVKTNKEWAQKLGIKQAARITCIKPEGTSSLVLGSGSGIHPHHAHRYFRRVQVNKQDPVYKFFKKHNPHMCEESVWSANKTDDVITFPIEVPKDTRVKADLSAIEHLEIIKSTQQNWVIPGTTEANKKPITHNVSCTVIVDNDEWDKVFNYIYDNKQYFTAVSLLPKTGDKQFKQAPNEAIVTEEDEKKWKEITSKYKHVNYKDLLEEDDNTIHLDTAACSGGKCEIV